ncbi:hypothetical protein AB0C35_43220, partial [Spirillospora sp. NPDC048819]
MSGHDDVPEWAPRNPPESGDPDAPYTFLGASYPGGVPAGPPGGAGRGRPGDPYQRARDIVATLVDALPSGSYLAIAEADDT